MSRVSAIAEWVKSRKKPALFVAAVLLLLAVLASASWIRRYISSAVKDQRDMTLYIQRDSYRMVLFKKPFTFWYLPQGSPLQSHAQKHDLEFAVNGTFFDGTYSRATPAGYLQVDGQVLSPVKQDRQLTSVFVYDKVNKRASMPLLGQFDPGAPSYHSPGITAFQTGPAVLRDNQLQTGEINGSINGNGVHLRTLLGYTDDGTLFVVVTTRPGTLAAIGEVLLDDSVFSSRKISVINLDGGPSTAFYSQRHAEFNFNAGKVLPLIIGVK